MSASPEMIDAVRVALGELYPAEVLADIEPTPGHPTAIRFWCEEVTPLDRKRAIRLARSRVHGHDSFTTCDTHAVTNRPDLWAQCEKVTVRDALMGHLCGAP